MDESVTGSTCWRPRFRFSSVQVPSLPFSRLSAKFAADRPLQARQGSCSFQLSAISSVLFGVSYRHECSPPLGDPSSRQSRNSILVVTGMRLHRVHSAGLQPCAQRIQVDHSNDKAKDRNPSCVSADHRHEYILSDSSQTRLPRISASSRDETDRSDRTAD